MLLEALFTNLKNGTEPSLTENLKSNTDGQDPLKSLFLSMFTMSKNTLKEEAKNITLTQGKVLLQQSSSDQKVDIELLLKSLESKSRLKTLLDQAALKSEKKDFKLSDILELAKKSDIDIKGMEFISVTKKGKEEKVILQEGKLLKSNSPEEDKQTDTKAVTKESENTPKDAKTHPSNITIHTKLSQQNITDKIENTKNIAQDKAARASTASKDDENIKEATALVKNPQENTKAAKKNVSLKDIFSSSNDKEKDVKTQLENTANSKKQEAEQKIHHTKSTETIVAKEEIKSQAKPITQETKQEVPEPQKESVNRVQNTIEEKTNTAKQSEALKQTIIDEKTDTVKTSELSKQPLKESILASATQKAEKEVQEIPQTSKNHKEAKHDIDFRHAAHKENEKTTPNNISTPESKELKTTINQQQEKIVADKKIDETIKEAKILEKEQKETEQKKYDKEMLEKKVNTDSKNTHANINRDEQNQLNNKENRQTIKNESIFLNKEENSDSKEKDNNSKEEKKESFSNKAEAAVEKKQNDENNDKGISSFQNKFDFLNKTEVRDSIRYLSDSLRERIENYKPPFQRLKLELNPRNLGSVDVTMVTRGNNLHITIGSNAQALMMLAQNSGDFKNSLLNIGFNDVSMNFNSQSGGNSSGQDGSGRHSHQERNGNSLFSARNQEDGNAESVELVIPRYI